MTTKPGKVYVTDLAGKCIIELCDQNDFLFCLHEMQYPVVV